MLKLGSNPEVIYEIIRLINDYSIEANTTYEFQAISSQEVISCGQNENYSEEAKVTNCEDLVLDRNEFTKD